MAIEINSKIVGWEVVKDGGSSEEATPSLHSSNIVQMHESVNRHRVLEGRTYKVSIPVSEHSLYVTINDIILNEGTDHEVRRPFEIFINSKNMEHFQWIIALTRILSAVFRKGGDLEFLVEELRSVFDPNGGYFKRGGKRMPSMVAEIGDVLEEHLQFIGMIKGAELDHHQKAFIEEKKREAKADGDDYPENAQLCSKCNTKAVIQMDGCATCLACGDSKCG